MSDALRAQLVQAVRGTALEPNAEAAATVFCECASDPTLLAQLPGPVFRGVARALASHPPAASFLAHRGGVLAALASAGPDTLAAREKSLDAWSFADGGADLEGALDALRLLRRDETLLLTCLWLAGWIELPRFSDFLSKLAETIAQRALDLARRSAAPLDFVAVGMGKIGGREFTYHSDLDLLFLYGGGAEAVDAASRVGQRLVTYLSTMTGAGVAYSVDARLRPSGGQGMLVTSLSAFERYQRDEAQTWEHVALLRARPIAGDLDAATETLERVRGYVRRGHAAPWADLAEMRARVEAERAAPAGSQSLKTGPGGMLDVDFLAGGALLEHDAAALPALPSVPAMFRAACGAAAEPVLADYFFLRRVEACARWAAGRGVEAVAAEALPLVAELVEPGWPGEALGEALTAARERVRDAYSRVVAANSIDALAD